MKRKNLTETDLWQLDPYRTILSILRYGKEKAIPRRELVGRVKIGEREVRKAIEIIRCTGVCVISDSTGYYLPGNKLEIERYIRKTERTAKSHFYTLRAARKALKKYEEAEAGG